VEFEQADTVRFDRVLQRLPPGFFLRPSLRGEDRQRPVELIRDATIRSGIEWLKHRGSNNEDQTNNIACQ
jgi:hypothetical protein